MGAQCGSPMARLRKASVSRWLIAMRTRLALRIRITPCERLHPFGSSPKRDGQRGATPSARNQSHGFDGLPGVAYHGDDRALLRYPPRRPVRPSTPIGSAAAINHPSRPLAIVAVTLAITACGLCDAGELRGLDTVPRVEVSLADGRREGDTTIAILGTERHEIPDVFIRGA